MNPAYHLSLILSLTSQCLYMYADFLRSLNPSLYPTPEKASGSPGT